MRDGSHFDKLAIRGYRGLGDLELENLGTFNVLLGTNDVGKTSVLEAIFLLTGSANLELPVRVQNWRNYLIREFDDLSFLFGGLNVDAPILLEAYSSPGERRRLEISAVDVNASADSEVQHLEGSGNGSVGIRGGSRVSNQITSSIPSGPRMLRYDATVERTSPGDRVSFSGTLAVRDGNLQGNLDPQTAVDTIIPVRCLTTRSEYDSRPIADVIVHKQSDTLLQYLRIINQSIEGIAASGDAAYVDVGLQRMIPLNMFGSGMVRAAVILSLCILGTNRMLLVDEVENGLHHAAIPPLLAALLKFSRDRGVQVFVTTHSLSVLEGLHEVLSRTDFSEYRASTNCYTLQKDREGRVRSYRYAYSQFEHCITHGIEIR